MFGNELEYKIPLPNSMRVAIINYNIKNIELATKIQEKVIITNKKKLQIVIAEKISELFKYKESLKDSSTKGLINKKWINNIINYVPSVVIINYQIKDGENKEYEEKNIYSIMEDIRNYSKSCFIFIIIIYKNILENKLYFNFDDKQKPNYLKNFLTKDCVNIVPDEQIWNLKEFGQICNKIVFYSREYYKNLKKKFNESRSQSKTREEKIEYDIKLGVISSIKSQKEHIIESKYLEEAYEFLCDKYFDLNTYIYGNEPKNIRNNFYEIRATADWLFFKSKNYQKKTRTLSMKSQKNKSDNNNYINDRAYSMLKVNIKEQIKKIERHIFCFSNNKYYENGKKDFFHFVEYYWIIQRYKNSLEYIEDVMSTTKVDVKILLKIGRLYFKQIYNLIRMIKFYDENFNDKDFNTMTIDINGKKIDIQNIKEEDNSYFGKPPCYYITEEENPEKKEIIGYNDEIYFKKFILNNKINYNDIIDSFKNKYWPNLSSFFLNLKEKIHYKKNNNNNDIMKGINIYINILKIIGLCKNLKIENISEISDAYDFYSKSIYNFDRIKKFPKVYMHFIKQYIDLIQYKMKKDNNSSEENYYKTELFINISKLGNLRKLDSNEENLFFKLLNDTQFIPKIKNKDEKIIINLNYYNMNNIGIIKYNNLAFNFDYSIKDIEKYSERKLLDLIEYEIIFKTAMNKEKIKFNFIKLFFEYSNEDKNVNNMDGNNKNKITEIITKEFNKEELNKYELSFNTPVNIIHKLLIKYKKGKILFKKIIFTLCNKENIYYSIDIPIELNKTIFIIEKETKILNIQYPKKMLTVGINQLFKFEYIINKEPLSNIKITDYMNGYSGGSITLNNIHSQIEEDKDIINKKKFINLKNNKNKSADITIDTLIGFLFDNSEDKNVSDNNQDIILPPPIFYFFNEDKNYLEEYKKDFEYIYNDFETRLQEGKNNYDILIKFSKHGAYKIQLYLKYLIQHQEVDEKLKFNHEEIFYFKVIDPLLLTKKITSNNFLLIKKNKEFLTDTNIKMNLNFKDLLDEDILIKDIIINLNDNENIQTYSTIKDIIDSKDLDEEIKENILCILKSYQYIIPFNIRFTNTLNGSFGKIKIIWTTKSLKEYINNKNIINRNNFNLRNENEYLLPNIDINRLKIKIDYDYSIKNDNQVILNLKINNISSSNKNLNIKLEKSDDNSYIISGLTKFFINLKIGETKKMYAKLIILQKGEIKLPDIEIIEKEKDGKQISCNYFCPEKIII